MNLADNFKNEIVSYLDFTPTALYLLSQNSTSDETRLAAINNGCRIWPNRHVENTEVQFVKMCYGFSEERDRQALTPLIYPHATPYGSFHLDMNTRLPIQHNPIAMTV